MPASHPPRSPSIVIDEFLALLQIDNTDFVVKIREFIDRIPQVDSKKSEIEDVSMTVNDEMRSNSQIILSPAESSSTGESSTSSEDLTAKNELSIVTGFHIDFAMDDAFIVDGQSSTARENPTADDLHVVADATGDDVSMAHDPIQARLDCQLENIGTLVDAVQGIAEDSMVDTLEPSDETVDEALGALEAASGWRSLDPAIDKLWDDFVAAEGKKSEQPISMLVKPGGHGPIIFALNYAPENETAFQDFGFTADPSQPCIRAMATKMGVPLDESSLHDAGFWMELCFRRCLVPTGSHGPQPYKALGKDVLSTHYALRLALWENCQNPLGMLLGRHSFNWNKANIDTIAVIPYSETKIFGEKASLRIEGDEYGNITRITVPVLHPATSFYNLSKESASLNDLSWNFVLACAGISTYNSGYFEYKASLKQFNRDADLKVNWGAMGTDLVTFTKATRKYELSTKTIVSLSEFPNNILNVLNEKKINLTGVSLGKSPSLALAKELCRLHVASHEEMNWPILDEGRIKSVEIHRQRGFPNLRGEANRLARAKNMELQRKLGWKLQHKASAAYVANTAVRTKAANEKTRAWEAEYGGFNAETLAFNLERDKQDLAKGVKPEVVAKNVAVRDAGRRAHAIAQQRADAVGVGVNKLKTVERYLAKKAGLSIGKCEEVDEDAVKEAKDAERKYARQAADVLKARAKAVGLPSEKVKLIERTLAKKAGLKLGKWREQHPLESLRKGEYNAVNNQSSMSSFLVSSK